MPITSHQIGGYIGGQQAQFGNFASYAQQISPGYGGPPPTYQNPMGGNTGFEAPPPPGDPMFGTPGMRDAGTSAISAIGNVGIPALGTAAMLGGAFMPGAVGGFFRGIDPIGRGLSTFGKGVGWQSGLGNVGANFGRMAEMGMGGVARAGLAGIGSGLLAAAPFMAAGAAVKYGTGQMVEGAQFQNQVGGFLQNQFRFQNQNSETGYGFGQRARGDISNVLREMGTQELMSTPQEMLRVLKQGTSMGLMSAVQDAKTFKEKFKEMVTVAKSISEAMQTTIEGAMPFMREARRMGFWTPQDITSQAAQTRATAATTGLSVSQVQAMAGQGAQMARSIGAFGRSGAVGMERTMGMVGGAVRSGVISKEMMSELTGGLEGPEAVAAMSQTLMGASARFASSNRGRWTIAALANRNMQGMDPARMQQFLAGGMSIGQIGNMARKNVSGNAFSFVMNEERLRGALLEAGPEAQAGFMRAQLGSRLYGGSDKDQYITRRIIQRQTGLGGQQADAFAQMLRNAPRIFAENERRTEASVDQRVRDNDIMMNQSYEGLKRNIGKWWDKTVNEPLQKAGAQMARSVNESITRGGDWLFGRTAAHNRVGALTTAEGQSLERYAMGDTESALIQFGSGKGLTARNTVSTQGTFGVTNRELTKQESAIRTAAETGKIDQTAAEGFNFKDVGSATGGIAAAKAQMGTFLRSQAVRDLQTKTQLTGKAWTDELARQISGGQIVAPKEITRLVRGAGVEGAAALSAAQTDEQRQWRTGLTVRKEGETDLARMDPSAVEKNMADAERNLLNTFTGKRKKMDEGIFTIGEYVENQLRPEDLAELKALSGGKFDEAAKLMSASVSARKSGDNETSERYRSRAMSLLTEVSTTLKDKPHLTKFIDEMTKSKDLSSLADYGKGLQFKASASYSQTMHGRMSRFVASMTEQGMEDMYKKLGSSDTGKRMRDVLKELTKSTGTISYDKRVGMLEQLAGLAASDPAKAAEALAMMQGSEGGGEISQVLKGGVGLEGLASGLTGKGSRRDKGAAGFQFLQSFMPGMSMKEGANADLVGRAIAGDESAVTRLRKGMDKTSSTNLDEFINLARKGDKAGLLALGQKGAAASGASMAGSRSLVESTEAEITEKMSALKQGKITTFGKGGIDGVFSTLSAHTQLFNRMANCLDVLAEKQGNGIKFNATTGGKEP
jgi:hypothetical protein